MLRSLMTVVRPLFDAVIALFAPTARADVWQPPSRQAVADYAARQLVGVLLVGAAAALCWRAEVRSQALPFLVIAVSRVPDLLVAVLALVDKERRSGLRPSRRPGVLSSTFAVVLVVAGVTSVLSGAFTATWLAPLVAGAGLAVSAWPKQLVYPASQRRTRLRATAQTGTSSTAPTA